ncbi:MotA/TolQ/ExbB proton channel family protein [bacterium]|nr:MotA/TolQ/ExbB proton channel family protein [bacterium]MBU1615351.1 MotA/TolQ/ExbB proton channel family protein [bacterium]
MTDIFIQKIDFLSKGGWLMIPLAFCSLLALAIVVERIFFAFPKVKIDPFLLIEIENSVKNRETGKALSLCQKSGSPLIGILKAAILKAGHTKEEIKEAILNSSSTSILELEKNLTALSIIGHISPLLGLLGTVTGMIKAFQMVQLSQGQADVSLLAGGIWEALLTTATGLSIAIPTIVFHHYLTNRANRLIAEIEITSNELVDYLAEHRAQSTEHR